MRSLTSKESHEAPSFTPPMRVAAGANMQEGEILFHFSHPQHPLFPVSSPYLFTCVGCKEYGAGARFRCQTCEFELHDFCALAPPSLLDHPFHKKHRLIFFFAKPGAFLRSKCEICSKTTKGFAYHCTTCGFVMHPCCAMMHEEMSFPTHEHPLSLLSPSPSMSACRACKRKRSGQVYCCMACGYNLHAICAKDTVNGLFAHGIMPPRKHNMLGAAARLATHAFLGIIGGLVEGIGEGIGEALIDSIGRSRTRVARSIRTK